MPSALSRAGSGRGWDGNRGGGARGRGLELLTVLFDAHGPLDVTAIARALGITRSAALTQLRELERLRFVARDEDGRWCLPPGGVMTLSATLVGRLNLRTAARPALERLAGRTGETVCLDVYNRGHRVRIDVIGGRPPAPALPLGETMPLPAGASGRVILAFVPGPAAAAAVAESGLVDEDEQQLRADLAQVRREGFLASVADSPGVASSRGDALATLAAPVFGSSGIAGAIGVVGPADRWGPDEMEREAASVRIECAALSAALGALD